MESLQNPNAVGLASVTHPAPSPAPTSVRTAPSLGQMGLGDDEEADEGFVEPLTISQLKFC